MRCLIFSKGLFFRFRTSFCVLNKKTQIEVRKRNKKPFKNIRQRIFYRLRMSADENLKIGCQAYLIKIKFKI